MKITLLGLLVALGTVLLIVYAVEMQQRKSAESESTGQQPQRQ